MTVIPLRINEEFVSSMLDKQTIQDNLVNTILDLWNPEKNQKYIIILGLTNNKKYLSGYSTLWFPLKDMSIEKQEDFQTIIQSNDFHLLYNIYQKYKIPFFNKDNLFDRQKEIIDYNESKTEKYFPNYIKPLVKGEGILINNNVVYIKNSEEINFKIDIDFKQKNNSIIIFKNVKDIDLDIVKNMIPFQVFKAEGIYNDKKFKQYYITYWIKIKEEKIKDVINMISECIKNELNTRYREDHISEEVLESILELEKRDLEFHTNVDININCIQKIDHFVWNADTFGNIFSDGELIKYREVVRNTWEEREGNPPPYTEDTEMNCNIEIFFGFCK